MMLEVSDVHAGYGKIQILKGVALSAKAGTIVGIIGPNGAGKSTLLKTILGYLRPSRGSCCFNGLDITGLRPDEIVRRGLSYVPQARGLFPGMAVDENLLVAAHLLPSRTEARRAVEHVYELFPALASRRRQLAGTMSGGERRLLEIARTLTVDPKMILLDEPSAALAPVFIAEVYAHLAAVRTRGIGLVLVEQNVDLVLDVADHVFALDLGGNVFDGPPRAFREGTLLHDLFLGIRPRHADTHS